VLSDGRRARLVVAELARRRLAVFGNVEVEISSFEEWDDRCRRFEPLVAGSA
jgi:hypothetical protein